MNSKQKGFGSDNHAGIHPEILSSILEINSDHSPSYGTDEITKKTIQIFKEHFGPDIDVYFVFNGTAANVLALSPFVQTFNSILCAESSHLNTDECGAPERHLGCKLIGLKSKDGKIHPQQIREHILRLGDQHYSQPKAISISQPTELGSLYSIEELKSLKKVADEFGLYIHMDGARFILAAESLKLSFKDLTSHIGIDSLSFGGTKNGLLFGEAVILFNKGNKNKFKNFKFQRKQLLQLPSKQRFISQQFFCLIANEIYKKIAKTELQMAKYLAESLRDFPQIEIVQKVESNVVFVKIPKSWIKPLRKSHFFYVWDQKKLIMRWMCSFDTNKDDIDSFIENIRSLSKINP